jgi:hypothetical protein
MMALVTPILLLFWIGCFGWDPFLTLTPPTNDIWWLDHPGPQTLGYNSSNLFPTCQNNNAQCPNYGNAYICPGKTEAPSPIKRACIENYNVGTVATIWYEISPDSRGTVEADLKSRGLELTKLNSRQVEWAKDRWGLSSATVYSWSDNTYILVSDHAVVATPSFLDD